MAWISLGEALSPSRPLDSRTRRQRSCDHHLHSPQSIPSRLETPSGFEPLHRSFAERPSPVRLMTINSDCLTTQPRKLNELSSLPCDGMRFRLIGNRDQNRDRTVTKTVTGKAGILDVDMRRRSGLAPGTELHSGERPHVERDKPPSSPRYHSKASRHSPPLQSREVKTLRLSRRESMLVAHRVLLIRSLRATPRRSSGSGSPAARSAATTEWASRPSIRSGSSVRSPRSPDRPRSQMWLLLLTDSRANCSVRRGDSLGPPP